MSAESHKVMRANGTIRVNRFVKIDTADNHSVLEADANERVIGISQAGGRYAPIPSVTADPVEAAQATESVEVRSVGASSKLYIGSGGCTAGDRLKSDADGKGVALATTGTTIQHYGAIALETAVEDELAEVVVVIGSERPALT